MRYIGKIVDTVRERTSNDTFTEDATRTTTAGISTNLILEFLNEAQEHLQASIVSLYPEEFTGQKIVSVTASTEAITVPDNVFINNKIIAVEYSHTGLVADYERLPQKTLIERDTSTAVDPSFYIRRGAELLLNPIPTTTRGTVRITYYRALDRLEVRRATISARTLTATQLTALTLSTTGDYATDLQSADFLCVNDKNGVVTMYNIPITSYDPSTGVVTLSAFTFASGETAAVSDFVTIGQYTTTHSKLPWTCERYLKLYAQLRTLKKDSSDDALLEDHDLTRMEESILTAYATVDEDLHEIPILDDYIAS